MRLRRLLEHTGGNIGVLSAMVMPMVIVTLGLGVDYGALTLEKRRLQSIADLSAIAAAAAIADPEAAVRRHFRDNGVTMLIETRSGFLDGNGIPVTDAATIAARGSVSIVKGHYAPDPAIAAARRFAPLATPANAVEIRARKQGSLFFAAMFADPPPITATGRAAQTPLAAFSIGSRLASLDGGIVNALLGTLLGASVSLDVMDYRALIDTDIAVQPFLRTLSTEIGLTAATYDAALDADIAVPRLFRALAATPGVRPAAAAALHALATATGSNRRTIRLLRILNLDPKRGLSLDAGSHLGMSVNALDLVTAAAGIANGGSQMALDLGATLPGLASTRVRLAIGEPPVATPAHRLGAPGSAVRTAQTRLAVDVSVTGLAALLGLRIELPLYVEVAYGEAKLAAIRCTPGNAASAGVGIDTVPGVAEVAIGAVDAAVLSNFDTVPRVTPARILDATLVRIDAVAHVEATNRTATRLGFSGAEIAAGTVKTVSTREILTSTTQSLLENLRVEIRLPLITLVTPTLIQQALAQTLAAVTPQIDRLLYNLLLVAGVRVGEADVRVTAVDCARPVLVQ
ncbi:pilus assembly protein TadG-related protein [Ensifer soli]|uniref:pilus assembly protein TadG-related protein n=1 Tax=Ciceribacter sp. sgz301302 TaxID=3342379 RepID=UPI0035BA8A67